MRILYLLLGISKADWQNEFGSSDLIRWDNWSDWSPCTNPCGEDGIRTRSRECRGGSAGEGDCNGEKSEQESCSVSCSGTCATNFYDVSDGSTVDLTLNAQPAEICFWSTAPDNESQGALITYDIISFSRAGEYYKLSVGDADHLIPAGKLHGHTCIILGGSFIKIQQDGVIRIYPANGYTVDSRVVTVGGGFNGSVSEVAVSSTEQNEVVRIAQGNGSACNRNDVAILDNNELEDAWSEWGPCSHNCGEGRSYRYRAGNVQMWRLCNPQPCADGWTDWSEWTPCDASCGGGFSHRTRRCEGLEKCDGAPNENKPCNGEPCPKCGYSSWKFPSVAATTNYLMVKPVLSDMSSVSICFSVENGMSELHGTVFSYSRGLDSPRGNELLFLGKDITNSDIRLYRRDQKISIPNDVLIAGEETKFCITLQSQSGDKIFTSIYVNGFIVESSTEGVARNGVALPGGGEMILGQDQDCILGCFNSSQSFTGTLNDFAIYDVALNPQEVFELANEGTCGDRTPVLTLEKDSALVHGKPVFQTTWADFGEWSSCSVTCGSGMRSRTRACKGGRPNDSGCPGSESESESCDTGVECEPVFESGAEFSAWSECSVPCGGNGVQSRVSTDGSTEEQACGDRACPELGNWSEWSECSKSCGDGFIFRFRECYNGPCEGQTQETTWCNLGVCVDSWNMPWPCGEVATLSNKHTRIVGGYEAQRAEIPWICILELRSDPICGASVIAPKWNIGASHCVSQTFDRPSDMRMLCGVHDRTITEFGAQPGQVVQYYKHPKYSGSTIDYDLCLFEMKDPWKFTDYVKPVCLPGMHQFPQPGTLCKVAGWGSVHEVAPGHFLWHVEMSRSLRAVHVPIIEQAQCAAKYKDQISRRMFCAGYTEGGRDACQGDSGGPIACQIGNDNPPRWQLTGVVSWGIGCAQKNLPGVYTKLSMLTDWIYDYIGRDAGRDPACNVDPLVKAGPRGQFTSPLYEEGGTYGYNMNCHWIIQLNPNKGLLAVTFTKFDLQYSKDCREDALMMYDGTNLDEYKGAWCGNSGPSTSVSGNSQSELKFVLTTNADNRGTTPTGFKAIWARARLRTQRQAGCAMPVEDFSNAGEVRSVQSFSWPLTPPQDAPITCVVVLRAKKNRQTKQLASPGLWFEEAVDPFCARKMTFYRQSKQQSKFIVNYPELFEGDGIIHKRPIFMLVFDGKNGGAQCRWKMHYVGCTRNEADCPDKFRQEVPKVQGHRADARSGADNARSCTLRTSSRPDQIGSSQDVGSHTRTSLVSMAIPKPPAKPTKQRKATAIHCSGSMIGNDKTFITSSECGRIVNQNWEDNRLGVYCTVGGEQILTRHCKVPEGKASSIAICQLDAAVNPETTIVPCYATSEVMPQEMLASESQTNLNYGVLDSTQVQKTWLPSHELESVTGSAVFLGQFSAGFSGTGHVLCNTESGTPIFREENGARELVGIVTSENAKCKESLTFTSIIRHNEFIANAANEFEPEAVELFEPLTSNNATCEPVDHVFDESCEPITISSPGYPELYGNNLNCQWNFQAPRNHLIKVELNDVDIEPSSHPRKCLFDRLEFAELGKIPTQICRHQYTDKTVVSYRDKATLSFETDDSVTARGFSAIVSCVRK